MNKEIIVCEHEQKALEAPTSHLIALALEKQTDPEVIKKMMDLQERWEASQARKFFVVAMTAFKQEAPAVLKKGDRVDFTSQKGRTAYNYANLGSIVQEITAILGKHELSASWNTSQEGNNITVTCHVTHSAGHRESVTLAGPADDSGNKNRIQAIGSTVTYLQRYTLLAALGLATGDDDDGQGGKSHKPLIQEPQAKTDTKATTEGSQIITTGISKIIPKTGKGPHRIMDGAGTAYNTFSDTIKTSAEEAQAAGIKVKITYKKSQYGLDIESVEKIEGPEEA